MKWIRRIHGWWSMLRARAEGVRAGVLTIEVLGSWCRRGGGGEDEVGVHLCGGLVELGREICECIVRAILKARAETWERELMKTGENRLLREQQ